MTKQEIVERLLKLAPENYYDKDSDLWGARNGAFWAFAKRLAENAVVVSGSRDQKMGWGFEEPVEGFDHSYTHTALLIDVRPIKHVDPLVEKLRKASNDHIFPYPVNELLLEAAERLEKASRT